MRSAHAADYSQFSGTFCFCALCNVQRKCKLGATLPEVPLILVVEDDDAIQGIVEDALSEGGFETAIARKGVTLLKGGLVAYRSLVTDINLLGRFNGWEVARAAREVDAAFPVIYMSGMAADQWAVQGVPNGITLTKPFASAQLVAAASQLLNQS